MSDALPLRTDGLDLPRSSFGLTNFRRPATAGWQKPTPICTALPAVEPFLPDLLPSTLRDYVMDVADRQQSPPDFAAVAAMCGLAAVAGNKVRIRPKQQDDWTVVPNSWGAIIGRPSAMKSPSMRAALAPVYALQDELRDRWRDNCATLAADDALAGLEAADARSKARKALKTGDRDTARQIIAGVMEDKADEPPCPRLVVNDATVEKLGELLNENVNGLLLVRDELPGWLSQMENPDCQGERAFFLESFNGDGSFTFDRIGRGTVHIESCTLSLIGGVQPSRIAPIVRGALSGASNDGLLQRLQMTVWPDDNLSWTWVDRKPDAGAREAFDRAFRVVHELPVQPGREPLVLRFSPEAQFHYREWVEELQLEARADAMPTALESHLLKMPKTVAGLALLMQLVDGLNDVVEEPAILRALAWADYLRSHANRLYAAGQTMVDDGARMIVKRRFQLPEQFTGRDVQRKGWGGLTDRDTIASAIEMLVDTHHCREMTMPAVNGRPSTRYVWNPDLPRED